MAARESQTALGETLRRLEKEFRDVSSETLEQYLSESVAEWDEAPVRAFIPLLAERRVRDRLRRRPAAS